MFKTDQKLDNEDFFKKICEDKGSRNKNWKHKELLLVYYCIIYYNYSLKKEIVRNDFLKFLINKMQHQLIYQKIKLIDPMINKNFFNNFDYNLQQILNKEEFLKKIKEQAEKLLNNYLLQPDYSSNAINYITVKKYIKCN
jgi:hypothetical protein